MAVNLKPQPHSILHGHLNLSREEFSQFSYDSISINLKNVFYKHLIFCPITHSHARLRRTKPNCCFGKTTKLDNSSKTNCFHHRICEEKCFLRENYFRNSLLGKRILNKTSFTSSEKKKSLNIASSLGSVDTPLSDCNFVSSYEHEFSKFENSCKHGNIIPLFKRIFSDHLTPVTAYKGLVKDNNEVMSFLLESVEGGSTTGRYSYLGAHPAMEIIAKQNQVFVLSHEKKQKQTFNESDPMEIPSRISKKFKPVVSPGLPKAFCGGWVGYTAYDTVRYVETKKLSFENSPKDDRGVADLQFALYNDIVVFDHVSKVIYVICWVHVDNFESTSLAFENGVGRLERLTNRVFSLHEHQTPKTIQLEIKKQGKREEEKSNMSKEEFMHAVVRAKEFILSGDIFQIVLSQRFERKTFANPFEIYRSLRIINPSPYMIYMQTHGVILVASSPEILCRISHGRKVVNRPLAGTRKRGESNEEDVALESSLLSDEKEIAEHVMLVDLGRNDVGKVSKDGSVKVEKLMEVERYSHVMHISSTVTGELKEDLDCWDALRAALPVGTVSGAPKVRAMELIDEFEPTKRGVYGGGMGYVSFSGEMDIALALRTMVIHSKVENDTMFRTTGDECRREWTVDLQAGAGIVADSDPLKEYEETVNKSAALARAIDLAESVFLLDP